MTSKAQRRANRLNARKSTGPRTPAGKAASRGNALKHGLNSPSAGEALGVWVAALGEGEAAWRAAAACELIARVRRHKQILIEQAWARRGDETAAAGVADRLLRLDRYERQARAQRRRALAMPAQEAI